MSNSKAPVSNQIRQANLFVDESWRYGIDYYCDCEMTKHAVGILSGFALSQNVRIGSYYRKANDLDYASMVAITRRDRRDGESQTVVIATEAQLKKLQQVPIFELQGCAGGVTPSFLQPVLPQNVITYTYNRSNVILVPKNAPTIVDAVGRVLYLYDPSALPETINQNGV